MTTRVAGPQPPVKPTAPQLSTRMAWGAALIVVLTMAAGGLALFMGVRMISREVLVGRGVESPGSKAASVKTPEGVIRVRQGMHVEETRLGMPVYPGAEEVKIDSSGPVRQSLSGHETVGVAEAAYQASDPISKVRTFYRDNLGAAPGFTERDAGGKTTFEFKRGGQQEIIALKSVNGGTRIELIRILPGSAQTN